ncbi:hypothetical protein [Sebaldella sp. S0638]|uniref:hypothetical protein n=1 Tax=Sebaldella sp. S0638 TaxID=2957809 RepID=UPI0020A215DA|nr:hypothetical protein [Sebaldella sp. S0638]MCP1226522.1 hypothetical protein [Sebaldella sp. S0638]
MKLKLFLTISIVFFIVIIMYLKSSDSNVLILEKNSNAYSSIESNYFSLSNTEIISNIYYIEYEHKLFDFSQGLDLRNINFKRYLIGWKSIEKTSNEVFYTFITSSFTPKTLNFKSEDFNMGKIIFKTKKTKDIIINSTNREKEIKENILSPLLYDQIKDEKILKIIHKIDSELN